MAALAYHETDRFSPQPILAGDGGNYDDPPENPLWCSECYNEGYERGFTAGANSIRKAPFITIDWSTLTGGIINLVAFGALILLIGWIGEMRGMKSEGRLNITVTKDKLDQTTPALTIRGSSGTVVVTEGKGDKL